MAFPTYVGAGTKLAVGNTTITPTAPTTWQADDILILVTETWQTGNTTLSTANGFAHVTGSPQTPSLQTHLAVFWKRATSGSDAMPVIAATGNHCGTQVFVFRGCETSGNPWNATNGGVENVSDTSWATVGVTTTVADCLVIEICANGFDIASAQSTGEANANLAALTTLDDSWMLTGDGGGFVVLSGQKATPGATGSTTGTFANAAYKAFLTIALMAPQGAAPATKVLGPTIVGLD